MYDLERSPLDELIKLLSDSEDTIADYILLLEKLLNGTITDSEINDNFNFLVETIKSNVNRKKLIDYILSMYVDKYTLFCFKLVYDLAEYKNKGYELLKEKKCFVILTGNDLKSFLYNNSSAIENISDNWLNSNIEFIDEYMVSDIKIVIDYILDNNILDMIDKFSKCSNLHVRYIFMNYLLEKYTDRFEEVYPDLINYLKENVKMMNIEDISNLAVTALKNKKKELYLKLKDYILLNYKNNDLGQCFIKKMSEESNEDIFNEFITDIDTYFLTSSRYKFTIYNSYSKYISKEILDSFSYYANIFKVNGEFDSRLSKICKYRLWDEVTKYVDKYMDLSNDKTFSYVASGGVTSVYRIGDYVLKINEYKWSTDNIICPNLYLIVKNLEEHYIRGLGNVFYAGIEVQKYLTRDVKNVPKYIFDLNFPVELSRLGYYLKDHLIDGSFGDNCMLLDSYKDADCSDPEKLPDWFKKYPVVLVDRDLVYKLGTKNYRKI